MIQAVIQGKASGIEYSEDILTSTVFGTLRYLPISTVLIPFIESAFLYDDCRITLWKVLKNRGIELRHYQKVNYVFWPRHSNLGEPDLLLLFMDHVQGEEDWLLIVEAKFKSPKSSTGEYDQLMRYYNAVNEYIEGFSDREISSFKGKKGYIIYVTESEAADEIEESIKCIKNKDESFNNGIFHLRWHQLHKVLSNIIDTYSPVEKLIASDIMKYLERLGLRDFSRISAPEKHIVETTCSTFPIFYSEINNASYFHKLPKVNIYNEKYCFYSGIKE